MPRPWKRKAVYEDGELVSNKKKVTVIIEECDLYPNRKQLQSYLINRVDKKRNSQVRYVKELRNSFTKLIIRS